MVVRRGGDLGEKRKMLHHITKMKQGAFFVLSPDFLEIARPDTQ